MLMKYEISGQFSERIRIVRAIAIILVVFVHAYRTEVSYAGQTITLPIPEWFEILQTIISKIIASSAVPVFFVISSILLYCKDFSYTDNLKKKIKTLLIPYLILNTFTIIVFAILQNIPMLSKFFMVEDRIIANWDIFDYINAYTGYRNGSPILYPLWFLRTLIILNIFSVLIRKIMERYPDIFMILATIIYLLVWNFDTIVYLHVYSFFYWILGCYIVVKKIDIERYKCLPIIFILYGIIIFADIKSDIYFFGDMIHNISKLMGLYVIIAGCTRVNNLKLKSILLYISKYSFCIYLFHEMQLSYVRKLCGYFLPLEFKFIFCEYFLCSIFMIIFCILISMLINKISPKIYGIVTGNRI